MDRLSDRSSTYFFPSDLKERAQKLKETPQPLLLIPLEENIEFFLGVFRYQIYVKG
jgi:hypothetical protein